jgi:hypothetical protein
VNLDLIYATPGETAADFAGSLDAVLAAGVDHVSAYALIVEEGTRLAAKVRRGEIPAPDDDVLADRYLIADDMLGAAGYQWYEISNWAAGRPAQCAHNQIYWEGGDWWGIGPGAHSHVRGTRWWNVRHPAAYAARLAAGTSPAQAREVLTPDQAMLEDIMLGVRLASGYPLAALTQQGRDYAERAVADLLVDPDALSGGRVTLTRRGRLLADAVVRGLTGLAPHQLRADPHGELAECAASRCGRAAHEEDNRHQPAGERHGPHDHQRHDGRVQGQQAGHDQRGQAVQRAGERQVQCLVDVLAHVGRPASLGQPYQPRCDRPEEDRAEVADHRPVAFGFCRGAVHRPGPGCRGHLIFPLAR